MNKVVRYAMPCSLGIALAGSVVAPLSAATLKSLGRAVFDAVVATLP